MDLRIAKLIHSLVMNNETPGNIPWKTLADMSVQEIIDNLNQAISMYDEHLKTRLKKINDAQILRIDQKLDVIQQHPLAVARSELENIIRETLRLAPNTGLQSGSAFEKAVESKIAHGELSRGNVEGAIVLLMKSSEAAKIEINHIQDVRWREDGAWDLPDFERPRAGMESDGWRRAHGCRDGKGLFGER